jgi:hypothetical protein
MLARATEFKLLISQFISTKLVYGLRTDATIIRASQECVVMIVGRSRILAVEDDPEAAGQLVE